MLSLPLGVFLVVPDCLRYVTGPATLFAVLLAAAAVGIAGTLLSSVPQERERMQACT